MRKAALHLALWTAIALIAASQSILTYLATGSEVMIGAILKLNLIFWYSWAVLSPAIWWAARRFPLQRAGWPRHALIHIAINAALTIGAGVIYRALRFAIGIPPRGDYTVMILSGLNTALLVYWSVIALAHALAYYRRNEAQRIAAADMDRQLAEARLGALRAQLQPHFLFNTLHAISGRVRQDPRGAEDMLGELGELLRTGLHNSPGQEITVGEELQLAERYIAIQRVRFQDRMHVERNVDPAVLPALVPVLVLQPLIENAIEHGIAARVAGGTLRIAARLEGSMVVLEVGDEGGPVGAASSLEASTWGIGLNNTRARLLQLHGEAAALELEAGTSGVVARVRVPFHTHGQ
jgi:two-component system, LytTR family, sensor kinase